MGLPSTRLNELNPSPRSPAPPDAAAAPSSESDAAAAALSFASASKRVVALGGKEGVTDLLAGVPFPAVPVLFPLPLPLAASAPALPTPAPARVDPRSARKKAVTPARVLSYSSRVSLSPIACARANRSSSLRVTPGIVEAEDVMARTVLVVLGRVDVDVDVDVDDVEGVMEGGGGGGSVEVDEWSAVVLRMGLRTGLPNVDATPNLGLSSPAAAVVGDVEEVRDADAAGEMGRAVDDDGMEVDADGCAALEDDILFCAIAYHPVSILR